MWPQQGVRHRRDGPSPTSLTGGKLFSVLNIKKHKDKGSKPCDPPPPYSGEGTTACLHMQTRKAFFIMDVFMSKALSS